MTTPNSDWLIKCAQIAEIDLVGIVDLEQLRIFRDHLSYIKDEDIAFNKGSVYDKVDYQKVWDRTKSILSFAMSYQTDLQIQNDSAHGLIAKVAYGKDYHEVMKQHGQTLVMCIKEFVGSFDYRIFVDNCVLSDRIMAYCSGLGFYGKNGFIINPKAGSFLYLGHILINIDINQDRQDLPITNQCADCTNCIDACPTGALSGEMKFDYRKCISYLTQKGKGDPTLTYLYGCDICQDVCPYNRGVPSDLHQEFKTSSELASPILDNVMNMTEEEFNQTYSESSLSWKGLKTMRKNAQFIISKHSE